MRIFSDRAWLKALSGLSINISAAFFVAPFVGVNFSFPDSLLDIFLLLVNIGLGIIFLYLAVRLERRNRR